MSGKFDEAKIQLSDGRVVFDALKLAAIPTEGVFVKDIPGHVVLVQTQNTLYRFEIENENKIIGKAFKPDGSTPEYLSFDMPVYIAGSTWGGSMLKMGYIGVEMHLEFTYDNPDHREGDVRRMITTSRIENIRVMKAEAAPKL